MLKQIQTILILFAVIQTTGQVIIVEPAFPAADERVVITLNTDDTELDGYTGDVYAHTGLTVDDNRWQYVIESWGNNETQPKLTKTGFNRYQLVIEPTIREYYGASDDDYITEMCFVFRSAESDLQTRPDIFYDVFDESLYVSFTNPQESQLIVQLNEEVDISWVSNMADSTFLYIDNNLVNADTGSFFEYDFTVENTEITWVKAVAINETDMVADSFYYYVRSEPTFEVVPAGIKDGVNYTSDTSVVLSLYAPLKEYVFAIGDFNNWMLLDAGYMKVDSAADRFWLEINGLTPNEEYAYQFLVDGTLRVSDPYAELVLDPLYDHLVPEENYPNMKPYPFGKTEGLVAVLQTNQPEYEWQHTNFTPPAATDLVVYELLIRDFVETHNFQTVMDTLPYLKKLGINALELMPVNEFDGASNWGYTPNHYFAVDKYYGTKTALKDLIDACHGEGIAVILDVVYNHATGISPYCMLYWDESNHRPAENSPFYNPIPKHDFNVFNDMNHESVASKEYISRAIKFWLEEFNIDGYRFDLSKGFTQNNTLGDPDAMAQYDQSRINILRAYADTAWSVNPEAYVILEHFAYNSEEKVLSDYGMMIWGNSNYNYNEATMSYNENGKSDFSWISYKKRNWVSPHVMGYMESHDEERLMYKNVRHGKITSEYSVRDTTIALQRMALAGNFFFTIPGPKMIWQFGEMGYDYSKFYDLATDSVYYGNDDVKVRPKPIRWDYLEEWRRRNLYYTWQALIELKKTQDVFKTENYELDVADSMKKIRLDSPKMKVVVLGNFGVAEGEIDPEFYSIGKWYDFWTADSIEVTDVNEKIMLQAGEYRLYTSKKLTTPAFVGIDDEVFNDNSFDINIYPNPATSEFTIQFNKEMESDEAMIIIFDLTGKKVKEIKNEKPIIGLNQMKVNVSNLKPGIYFMKTGLEGRSVVKKLIIQ